MAFVAYSRVLLLLALSTFALGVTVGVEPKAVEVKPGENFTLSIVVDPQGSGVSGGEIAVFFKGLEVVDVSAGDLLGPRPLVGFKYVDNAEGVLKVAIARVGKTEPPTPRGKFATITLRANAPGVYYVKIAKAGFADENFKDLKVTAVENATVVVKGPTATSPTAVIPPATAATPRAAVPDTITYTVTQTVTERLVVKEVDTALLAAVAVAALAVGILMGRVKRI